MSIEAIEILQQDQRGAPGYSEGRRRRTAKRCACGALGWFLCDVSDGGSTCDAVLCARCRVAVGHDVDACHAHAAEFVVQGKAA